MAAAHAPLSPQKIKSAPPEPKLERQHLPADLPRPRASLHEKSKTPSIGGLIHSMQAKPSKTPYYIAAITSVIWLFIGGLLGWLLVGQTFNDFTGYKAAIGSSSVLILAAAVLVPIALFWFIAQLIVRSQEMKLMASAMTEVAVRLAEPDKMAEQKVASVGQTIRRQVSAMDDAISRAIGRAGELEALVHNEVAALERSYSQNEYIIRNLLNELVNEREAIAHNGLQVKHTLQGVGAQVSKDIRVATEGIGADLSLHGSSSAAKLQQVGTMSAMKLQHAGDQVTKALQTTTDQTVAIKQKISAELPQLLTKMNVEQDKLSKVIDGANANLGQLDTTLAKRTTEIDTVISKHTGEMNKKLVQKVKALDASLAMRTKAMDKTLTTKAAQIDKTFLAHQDDVDTVMQKKAIEIDRAIAKQAEAMDASLTQKARTIDAALTQHVTDLDKNTATNSSGDLDDKTAENAPSGLSMLRGSEALERAMSDQSKDLQSNLKNNSTDLNQTIAQQNQLSPEITALSQKHDQLLKEQLEHAARMAKQFSAEGNDLRATAGLLDSPDMKMNAMMGPQQNQARAVLADIISRSEGLEKSQMAYASALDNSLTLGNETATTLSQLLAANGSPKAEQAIANLNQSSKQSLQNVQDTKTWMKDYSHSVSLLVVEMVTGMSRSSSRTKILPGEVANTSTDIKKSVQEQLQALDALAQLSGAALNTSYASATSVNNGSPQGSASPGQGQMLPQTPGGAAMRPGVGQNINPSNAGGNKGSAGKKPSQWSFGDLLARVADTDSENEEPPLPTYRPASASTTEYAGNNQKSSVSVDPLDVLRMDDIARALDSHTAALAWKRSQAGERDVFTRRLYTPEGQITFDQISERYRTDDGFQSTVEKYVNDFEGLMKEAIEKDPSGRIIQNYLTSETGRAYLMLAHISGRLG